MTRHKSAKGTLISLGRIRKELEHHRHGKADLKLFVNQVKETRPGLYDAGKVLEWLGY